MTYIEPHMVNSLKDHILVEMLKTEKFASYYLRKPGGKRMMSTLITFTPEGIVLQGDLTPTDHGTVSTIGYGPDWFASQLSESYLCEKFLQREFVPSLAREGLKWEILCQRRERELTKDGARELWKIVPHISDGFEGPTETYEFWTDELKNTDGDGCPGYGYNPGAAGWLCAIQQRFAALYREANQ